MLLVRERFTRKLLLTGRRRCLGSFSCSAINLDWHWGTWIASDAYNGGIRKVNPMASFRQ